MNPEIKPYPADKSKLLAWNASDEYLLKQFASFKSNNYPSVLIINDSNGFLSVNLNKYSPVVYSDSFINLTSIKKNCRNNNCAKQMKFYSDINQLIEYKQKFDIVIFKLPKSVSFLKQIINGIKPSLAKNAILISAGMTKHISNNTHKILNNEVGSTDITKVYKKSIAFISRYQITFTCTSDSFYSITEEPEFDLKFFSLPNVFSLGKLDRGTTLLLKNISGLSGDIVDLGCGAGPISLYCKKKFPEIKNLTLVDESWQAIASAKKNFKNENFDAEFIWGDGLTTLKKESVDFVISNPPFHKETSVNMQTALRLFKQTLRVLKKKGVFILVFNKTLSYEPHLKKLFYKVEKIAKNNRYFVYKCIK